MGVGVGESMRSGQARRAIFFSRVRRSRRSCALKGHRCKSALIRQSPRRGTSRFAAAVRARVRSPSHSVRLLAAVQATAPSRIHRRRHQHTSCGGDAYVSEDFPPGHWPIGERSWKTSAGDGHGSATRGSEAGFSGSADSTAGDVQPCPGRNRPALHSRLLVLRYYAL